MDLSSGQQRLLFAVVVVALAGLGIYLVSGGGHHGSATAPATPSAASATPTTQGVPAASLPAVTPPAAGSGPDIYQWLPFSQQDLATAARTTTEFAAVYAASMTYTETKQAYAAKLASLTTPAEAATLLNGWSAPGLASLRAADKAVATGSGSITAIRSFGNAPASITFLVTIDEQLASKAGTKHSTGDYAVTVIASGGRWQVNDIELSGLGNQ